MNEDIGIQLGRRERQIVEVLYRLGKATVAEVLADLPDPPGYSAVRGMLGLLEEKGYVRHKRDGMRYVYAPAIAPAKARQSALRQLVSTFFEGSPLAAAAALLEMSDHKFSPEEREQLAALIARREKEGQ
ncbi:MAG TPA: BlaI/MecI/CopY family transcriptional regulator [Bryobacteraceae bacterium]|nr:BlaI/MecI/CopY family transcriptional regulator [Bryobacteraceae bacterium]